MVSQTLWVDLIINATYNLNIIEPTDKWFYIVIYKGNQFLIILVYIYSYRLMCAREVSIIDSLCFII